MEALIFAALGILAVLVLGLIVVVLLRGRTGDVEARVRQSFKDELLQFQSGIREDLNTARTSVESAKDVISSHALKTLSEISSVRETAQKLVKQQEEAQGLAQSLKDLLQAPKLRGNYGEAILEEMLDRVLPKGFWERQYSLDGSERVDCVVKIKDVVIPIDAKFPRNDYLRYLEAEAHEDRASLWRSFETSVIRQATSIEAKYVKPELGTSDFALMFIPSEAIYYETIAENNHLGQPSAIMAHCQNHRVMPVSPNTFYGFLQMVIIGIRNTEVIKSAKQLQQGLSNLEKSFDLFYKKYEEMGRRVSQAAEAYRVGDGHIDRFKHKLDETLQLEGFQDESMELLPDASPEEHAVEQDGKPASLI